MSKEGSPELTKSWVFVDPDLATDEVDEKNIKDTSGIQDVTKNEPHSDSDTDSISIISESGCSYKTDEDEFFATDVPLEKEEVIDNEKCKTLETEPQNITEEIENLHVQNSPVLEENKEKLLYFATSALCAIILVGFSVAAHYYFPGTSDENNFDMDQQFAFHAKNLKSDHALNDNPSNKFSPKSKNVEEFENKIIKRQIDDKMIDSVEGNDLKLKGNVKSIYKVNKNKNPARKCNKENCDVSEKRTKNYDPGKTPPDETNINDKYTKTESFIDKSQSNDEIYDKKIKQLKIKEDYLKQKEKFLIEKEHDLLKQEIKLNKEKQHYTKNKHEKKRSGEKDYDDSSEEDDSDERKDKHKSQKHSNVKPNKKNKYKEEKKKEAPQKRFKFSEEQDKKRNISISGQWYINLHEARDSMRQRRRSSFKRNKAHWYFQWMVDRARLRVK